MTWCLQPVCSWLSFQSSCTRGEGKPMIQKREETRGYKGWEAKYYETGPLHQVRNLGRITRNRPTPKSSSSRASNKIISWNKLIFQHSVSTVAQKRDFLVRMWVRYFWRVIWATLLKGKYVHKVIKERDWKGTLSFHRNLWQRWEHGKAFAFGKSYHN